MIPGFSMQDLDALWQLANGLSVDCPCDESDQSSAAETFARAVARLLTQRQRREFKSRWLLSLPASHAP